MPGPFVVERKPVAVNFCRVLCFRRTDRSSVLATTAREARGGCKIERKWDDDGYKEEVKCKRGWRRPVYDYYRY
jgi:hypothetical protein